MNIDVSIFYKKYFFCFGYCYVLLRVFEELFVCYSHNASPFIQSVIQRRPQVLLLEVPYKYFNYESYQLPWFKHFRVIHSLIYMDVFFAVHDVFDCLVPAGSFGW